MKRLYVFNILRKFLFYVFTTFENNFQMDQDSLQCDGTTAAVLNDLFSESPSVVDSAVERIRTAWTRKE